MCAFGGAHCLHHVPDRKETLKQKGVPLYWQNICLQKQVLMFKNAGLNWDATEDGENILIESFPAGPEILILQNEYTLI